MSTQTGIFPGVSREEYGKIDACNQSSLKPYAKSAMQGKFDEDNRKESDEMVFGTALHTAVLEPDEFTNRYTSMPKVDGRTKEGKLAKAAAIEAAKGKIILPETGKLSLEWLTGSRDALMAHPDVANLFKRGMDAEAAIVWKDRDTGILCKALTDAAIQDSWPTLGDIKSSGSDVDEESFGFTLFKWGMHIQAAFYIDGYQTITGKLPNFVICPVESKPPHHVMFYQVTGPSIALGRKTYKRILPRWAKAKATGQYPGLPTEPREISVPGFRLKELDK